MPALKTLGRRSSDAVEIYIGMKRDISVSGSHHLDGVTVTLLKSAEPILLRLNLFSLALMMEITLVDWLEMMYRRTYFQPLPF